ncbi:MAG: Helix-turn-helix domain [Candidatus Sulfotelmatobacter sp.]|nr:Helix-turn-helix domain [Candidatus Sulfotelmatobacter sp.]
MSNDEAVRRAQRIVGMNIRSEREAQKITQKDLAQRCEISSVEMGLIECGERDITVATVLHIAEQLGVSVYILTRDT